LILAGTMLILAGAILLSGTSCAPALHATAMAPVSVQVRTSFFESDGHRIRVDVYQPARSGRRPAVVVIHGSSGVHKILPNTASRYARALAEQGLITFVVHYFDVTGTVIAGASSESDHYYTWAKVLRDAVSWVAARPDVDPDEVGILGHSLGAFLAVGVAAFEPRVSRVVLFGGGLEPFLTDSIQRMPPTLVVHGEKDKAVPLWEAMRLVAYLRARGCEVEIHVLPGEGHIFSESAVNEALTEATRFFVDAPRDVSAP
jgi:dipeptidyl aminopeptidase/acylaminoacyl peptidase